MSDEVKHEQEAWWAVITADVLYSKELTPRQKLLYAVIGNLSNKKGYCFAANSHFAEMMGCSIQSIQRDIRRLEESGAVNRVVKLKPNGEVEFRALTPMSHMIPPISSVRGGHITSDTGGHITSDTIIEDSSSNTIDNNKEYKNSGFSSKKELLKQQKQKTRKEPPNSDSPPTLFPPEPEPTFEEFWDKYQKKVDTAKCKTKWRRLKPEEKQAIMDHLDEYIPATPDKQYRRNPLTYLNNRTWEDEELPTFGGRNGRLPVHDTTKNAAGRHERTGFDQ